MTTRLTPWWGAFALSQSLAFVALAETGFVYDSLHRLTRIEYENGASIAYTYAAARNPLTLVAHAELPPDRTAPVIQINQPTNERIYVTTASSVSSGATASDATGITVLSYWRRVRIMDADIAGPRFRRGLT